MFVLKLEQFMIGLRRIIINPQIEQIDFLSSDLTPFKCTAGDICHGFRPTHI